MYLLIRVLGFVTFAACPTGLFFVFFTIWLLLFAMMLAIAQPYKSNFAHYMPVTMTFFLLLAIGTSAIAGVNIAAIKTRQFTTTCAAVVFIVVITTLIYISVHAVQWVVVRRKFGVEFLSRIRALRRGYEWWVSDGGVEESLPDRINNPQLYHEQTMRGFHSNTV